MPACGGFQCFSCSLSCSLTALLHKRSHPSESIAQCLVLGTASSLAPFSSCQAERGLGNKCIASVTMTWGSQRTWSSDLVSEVAVGKLSASCLRALGLEDMMMSLRRGCVAGACCSPLSSPSFQKEKRKSCSLLFDI